MLAGLAHKWNWREARKKAGKDSSRPNMVTGGNVQIVWKKFLRYFDVEPRIVPLKPTIGLLGPIAASFPLALRR